MVSQQQHFTTLDVCGETWINIDYTLLSTPHPNQSLTLLKEHGQQ